MMRAVLRQLNTASSKSVSSFGHFSKIQYATSMKPDFKSQFDQDGYLVVRNCLNKRDIGNLIRWSQEIEQDAFQQRERYQGRGLHHFEVDKNTDKVRICRSEKLIDFHSGLNALLCAGKLKSIVSECFGEECALYKEKINYKYPHCGSFKPHQDAPAFPDVTKSISCAISIDESTSESGCLEIAAGRHKEGLIGQNDQGIICDDIAENVEHRKKVLYQQIATNPGDIILFDGYAPHKSAMNKTDKPRRIVYATYNPLSEGDFRSKYYETKANSMLDGKISFIFDFDGNVISTIGK